MRKYILLIAVLKCVCFAAFGQKLMTYRPRVSEVTVSSIGNYSAMGPDGLTTRIQTDRLWQYRFGIPLVLREKTLFGVQLKHTELAYQTLSLSGTNEPLYEKLDEGKLFNTGINLLYQRTLENSKQLILIGVSELASNEFSLNRFAGRHYISGMLTRKPNERVRWGYGGVVNYALGVWNVYPTLLYHRQLRDKWLLELNLPGNAQLRFHPDNKTHIIAKLAFDNWRYNVTDALQDGSGQFTLQRADIYGGLMLEKQLYDWLWLAGEVSYLSNLSFFVAEPGERLRNAVEEFKVDDSTQLKFSLFLVPPQKLWSGIKAR
ncbi:DUF6268 family outer membrane beta-barrel protein [Roseivirga thermotolerans]|uniref:DUF6268 family outer membrane beta-barrel protein n=1 Tax=Roseivirga thermotolerans TaxID=1758176 RepID=UPI001679C24D|nr:DUF6268 family outer membrane beta-barrel protein [Roseivirga thermotolerans]